jgi:ammonia channel protein AmtB
VDALLDFTALVDSRWVLAATLLVLDLWCIGLLLASDGSVRSKLLWSAIILLCPIIGCVLWYVLGPKPRLVPEEELGSEGSTQP